MFFSLKCRHNSHTQQLLVPNNSNKNTHTHTHLYSSPVLFSYLTCLDDVPVEVGARLKRNKSYSVVVPAAQQAELSLQRSYSMPMHNAIRATTNTTPVHLTLDRQRLSAGVLASPVEYGDHVESAHLKLHQVELVLQRGPWGFGFTFTNSPLGHKVTKILDEQTCRRLLKGDIIKEINQRNVETLSHTQVVALLKEVPIGAALTLLVLRQGESIPGALCFR